ncbi:MAG: HD domain-containing protein, partial [Nitrospinota bacterium]|nr:HD domain-containing protein [Nitrospinota bacterium]
NPQTAPVSGGQIKSHMRKFGDEGDIEEFFRKLISWSSDLVEGRRAYLFFLDGASGNLLLRGMTGGAPGFQVISPRLLGDAWADLVAGRGLRIAGGALLSSFEDGPSGGWLLAPLVIRDQLIGVILVERDHDAPFTDADLEVLLSYNRSAGLTLENNFLYRQIFRGLRETLQLLVSILEARDVYTKDHAVRVTQYALMMADILGCAPEQREMLEFAGRLHDIGKVGIQDAIMLKPDSLSRNEMESMRRHPVIGEQIVRSVCLLTEERAVVRNHHEWWNGDGYPDHLMGEKIPLLARILSVADAFDAMTSDRPYRDAMSPQQALCNLEEAAGVQFDKDLVEAFRATAAGKRAGEGAKHGQWGALRLIRDFPESLTAHSSR